MTKSNEINEFENLVLFMARKNGSVLPKEIREAVDINEKTLCGRLRKMVKEGKLERNSHGEYGPVGGSEVRMVTKPPTPEIPVIETVPADDVRDDYDICSPRGPVDPQSEIDREIEMANGLMPGTYANPHTEIDQSFVLRDNDVLIAGVEKAEKGRYLVFAARNQNGFLTPFVQTIRSNHNQDD